MSESASVGGVRTKPQLENYYRWVEPDSDITVCLKLEMVDRLQMEVLRGVDSFSHSGNEVGGILLGRTELDEGRSLTFVDDFEPIPCDHRRGPSYVLSAKEAANFEAVLAQTSARQGPSVLGYYRSHNREGLFLSAEDLHLIQHHFRGADNLFLLIKTLPKGACTAGFFFWKDGRIQSEFTDSEAPLLPVSLSSGNEALPFEQAIDAISPVLAAAAESGSKGDLKRRLIRGLAVTGVAAAATMAVVQYWETRPGSNGTPGAPRPVPVASTTATLPPPTPVGAPEPAREQPAAPSPASPKTAVPQARNNPATAIRDEAKPPAPAPALDTPPARPPVASEPVAQPVSKPLTSAAEQPLNTAPTASAETKIPPVAPVTPHPVAEAPPKPAAETSRPEPAPRESAAPDSTSAPPVTASSSRLYVAPQVIHQAIPAVPHRVEPMITSDVQVDVSVSIDAKGKVTGARVASTKGAAAGLLTIEALKAAQLFRFRPAQENGLDVAGTMVITFRFARKAK